MLPPCRDAYFCTALLEAGITNAKGGLKNPGKLTSDNGYEVRLSPANVVQMQQTERGKALPQAVQHVGHGH